MWVRLKRWQQLAPNNARVRLGGGGRRYVFSQDNQGLVDVRHRTDIEQLLDPPDGVERDVEIAYDKYGVEFDEQGMQVGDVGPASEDDELEDVAEAETSRKPRPSKTRKGR